jgi:hypothetical protein
MQEGDFSNALFSSDHRCFFMGKVGCSKKKKKRGRGASQGAYAVGPDAERQLHEACRGALGEA